MPLTIELDQNVAVNKFIPFQNFAKSSPFMTGVPTTRVAEWQAVVVIGLLRIVVGPHFVYPQHYLVAFLILLTTANKKWQKIGWV